MWLDWGTLLLPGNPGFLSHGPLQMRCHPTISSSVIPFSCLQHQGLQPFPSIRVFSHESVICIRWPEYWSFNFSISPSNEYSGLISFRTDWLDLLAVQGTLKSLLQHDRSKATILRHLPLVAVINIARNIILRQGGSVCMDCRVEVGDGWG